MGCGPSKEDAEGGAASRCRERKHLLRAAVQARHALAGAHAGHAAALRNVGAALSDYAAGEADRHDAAVALPPPPLDAVLPPPPPPLPPGAEDAAAPLQRSMSAPDIPLQPNIRKARSGEAPIMEEEEGEGEGGDDDAPRRRRGEDDPQLQPPPPPPPANAPPPSRSPPPVPDRKPASQEGDSFTEYIFGPSDAVPVPRPTLDPGAAGAETSWAAERRDPAPPPPPPPPETDEQPPPPPETVAEGKKLAVEPVARRAAKASRKAEGKKARIAMVAPQPVRLGDVLRKLDEHFLKASEGAHEVSKMLEAARMHYHSNFADTRGFVDHSARVMQVITWNRSFKGIPQPENAKNELDDDEWETHATVLDKLLAWEKKLCHEVKEFEVIKVTYQRKLAVLNRKKQRGVSSSSIEKTKSIVSHLHTKYIVDSQTMESTVAEINRLRDQQLYPKLLELVKGLSHMWDIMYAHHKAQLRIITELKSSDITVAARETSEQHHERTVQLWSIVQEWHAQFDKFMTYQKEYVGSLYSWIKLNVIPIDADLKPNSSQPHETTPPIKRLLHAWHDILEKLPDNDAKKAIHTFAEVVHTILVQQEDELKLRIKIEETRRDLEKKRRQFDDWAQKNWDRGASIPDGNNPGRADPAGERKAVVDRVENALKDLEDQYKTQCKVVRDKSLNLLRSNLPELFRAVSDFSLQSAGYFKGLWSIAQTNDQLDD
nr:nitrate regulatory gene2 protein-like [Setaria viridis]